MMKDRGACALLVAVVLVGIAACNATCELKVTFNSGVVAESGNNVEISKSDFIDKVKIYVCKDSGCSKCPPAEKTDIQMANGQAGIKLKCPPCEDQAGCGSSGGGNQVRRRLRGGCDCFPAAATMRRMTADGAWEAVPLPQLRIGDAVECFVRQPAFSAVDASVTSAPGGEVGVCQVYDYKKANAAVNPMYTHITYDRPESARPGVLSTTANHHVLDAKTGLAVMAGSVAVGDAIMVMDDDGIITSAQVLAVESATVEGAYSPMLTKGGLPIVDGAVAYPTSGTSDVGLDAKHWGQYYLAAPIWQALHNVPNDGRQTLAELGAHDTVEVVGAFTRKFYAVAEAAAKEGRTFRDWAGVAAEMHAAITNEGKVYSEEEALAVYDRHIRQAIEKFSMKCAT